MASPVVTTADTPVTIKVNINGTARRFKLPLRDVGINVLENKLRDALNIPADADALFERYSDSAGAYVILDQANTGVYKQLYRAAKAKHKLKLRITVQAKEAEEKPGPQPASVADEPEEESRPSVEPTDSEREPEQPETAENVPDGAEPAANGTEDKVADPLVDAEAAPQSSVTGAAKAQLRAMKEMLDETLKEPKAPGSPQVPAVASPCAAECPELRGTYVVCCNNCDQTIPDAHYHCATCDEGDFDLCQDCVDQGVTCKGSSHWLIKRFVKDGVIINSTTERLAPKPRQKARTSEVPVAAPIAAPIAAPPVAAPVATPSAAPAALPERIIPLWQDFANYRTCNNCVMERPEKDLVHCTACEDFDLCTECFAKNEHGHDPKHAFVPVVANAKLSPAVTRRLAAGRDAVHHALCDGCDAGIRGVRHKCLDCPDWDYCSACVVNAPFIHPGHRLVPIYEPLACKPRIRADAMFPPIHVGICCDGPLCGTARTNSSYIEGDRYKCAVCHDTDFCASCEASPANNHNRTHPLIKFKTPVRHVSVTTTGETPSGRLIRTMGDRPTPRPAESSPAAEARASPSLFSGVHTVVDVQPSEPAKVEEPPPVIPAEKAEEKPAVPVAAPAKPPAVGELVATYISDTVQDGTVFEPDHVFEQTWVLRNTGNVAWPADCFVRFVSGDYMGSLASDHAAATEDVRYSFQSAACTASIQPGCEYPFTVSLRTPPKPGRYVSYWRLSTKEGELFGHRLWCDINVKPKEVVVLRPAKVFVPVSDKLTVVKREAEAVKPEAEPSHSQMIFPKLEKESPVASVVREQPKAESVSTQDEYEDCEDIEWQEGDSEQGFLTDEEYDILDASDEEFHLDGHKQK